jgi:hypothetical protein
MPFIEKYHITSFIWIFNKNNWNFIMNRSNELIDLATTDNTCIASYESVVDEYSEDGKWEFNSNKEKIEMTFSSNELAHSMKIIELKEKKMKLEMYDRSDLKFTFVKK